MGLRPFFLFAGLMTSCVAGRPSGGSDGGDGGVAQRRVDVVDALPQDASGPLRCHRRADCSGGEICCASPGANGFYFSRCSADCPGDADEGTILCDAARASDECRVFGQRCVAYAEIPGESHCAAH